jgi:hypothetical protein
MSIIDFYIAPGIDTSFFLNGDYFLLNYMTIFYFLFSELLFYLTLNVVTDFTFLFKKGDSIFLSTKLETSSFLLLLNIFS